MSLAALEQLIGDGWLLTRPQNNLVEVCLTVVPVGIRTKVAASAAFQSFSDVWSQNDGRLQDLRVGHRIVPGLALPDVLGNRADA